MKDSECVAFLQWCLPRLSLRWLGFRRVRRQVCKRVGRRVAALGLDGADAYRAYLDRHSEEWAVLDGCCRITVSRFYRDRGTFDALGMRILPRLADLARSCGHDRLRCWSAGCASGEETYSLAISWHESVRPQYPTPPIDVLGTDSDAAMVGRAVAGCYGVGSLKEVPGEWLTTALEVIQRRYCVREPYRTGTHFARQDLRTKMPDGPFHLILCRNLAFTYFDEPLQQEILAGLAKRLVAGGVLVIGRHETLPPGSFALRPEPGRSDMFVKSAEASS